MSLSLLERLESDIDQLSLNEQLWLMERLAQSICKRAHLQTTVHDHELMAMAQDPAIQREIREINEEFRIT